ncbi:hypothetical protein GBAR_LOCUS25697 [Geodia barretti]|uniref:Uncharacterized protein n=1 Tax=Geodia barretti TaxID=519541 RepID=A0AA35TDR2_GEOBA|nr:hypothetical protein GBAR_LOCUS25697 [Geodia barretti]
MIDPVYLNVLRQIHARLSNTDVNWVVTGSLGFVLQGVPVRPNDIDIQTDKAGAYAIESLFSDVVIRKVKFSATEWIRSHFGALQIDGIEVEIMGDIQKIGADGVWEEIVDPAHYRQMVEIAGLLVPVLSLEYEYQAYLKFGRIEQAKMLRRWLDSG